MLRRFAQLLRSSEIGRFSGVASSDSETQNDQKCENHEKSCFFYVFASYTWRMVFILCQIDQLTFPTDSENMNPIRALFLVENHDFNFQIFAVVIYIGDPMTAM